MVTRIYRDKTGCWNYVMTGVGGRGFRVWRNLGYGEMTTTHMYRDASLAQAELDRRAKRNGWEVVE